jgi:hypothetical protein
MKPETVEETNTSWHRFLARLLELVLSPLDIEVQPDVSVMTDPPEADILLVRRKTPEWTAEQRTHLPDGIRDSKASHILLEFKYTQSFNEHALQQALGYDFFYKQAKKLPHLDVQTVLLSAKKTQSDTLTSLGYQPTKYAGVYRSQIPLFKKVLLLSLNELSNEPHNLWLKCFASRKLVKKQAFQQLKQLKQLGVVSIANELQWFINGLMQIWFGKGEKQMNIQLTPEDVSELGKQMGDIWFANLTVDELLDRLGREEVLSHIKLADRLAGLEPKEVLSHFKPVDRLAGLEPKEVFPHFKPKEVLSHFKPVDRLAGLTLPERLAGLEPEVIEEYLKQLKKQPK